MRNFITNSGAKNLKERLSELIMKSEELKFLVGFFYFSGLRELYTSLTENPSVNLKVLVGLNVNKLNYQIVEFADSEDWSGSLSNEEIYKKFLDSLRRSINTERFDTKEFYEQARFLIGLIKAGRLTIRKTIKPNHAKLYIFKLKPDQIARDKLFITGSSNLTSPGLTTQEEFNVEISDYGCDDAEKYFDHLWEDAIEITEDALSQQRLIEVLEKETLIKEITPFEAYALVLKIYLESFEKKEIGQSLISIFETHKYIPYRYQLDAIQQALAIIEKNNGVILADVVGLGKTIIACAIARELKKRGVIICPPGLMGEVRKRDAGWNMYKEQFGLFDWEVWSLGDLGRLQEQINSQRLKDVEVVIIDEAHRFRNQDTKSYEYLKNICRNKIVILLTATPFNNRPEDIFSLLKLFISPKRSTITLENNLVDRFRSFKGIFERLAYIKKYHDSTNADKRLKAHSYYRSLMGEGFTYPKALEKVKQRSKYLAKQVRDVIEPVTIRRNRLDLQNNPLYKDEVQNLSKVTDPQEWFFALTKEQSLFYDRVIKEYFADPDEGGGFKGAIYRPFEYEKIRKKELSQKESFEFVQQRNLYDFMRRLLVKRFESSVGSFEQSLKNFRRINETVLRFIEKTERYILDRDLLERIYDKDLEDIEARLSKYSEEIEKGVYPKNHKIYKLSEFKYKQEFIDDINSDLKLFGEIIDSLDKLGLTRNDPKAERLIQNLKSQLGREPERKIVIFSEYVDTVRYLQRHLEGAFSGRVLTIVGDLSEQKLNAIYQNFDASYHDQKDDYSILLTSDKLSEGFNLNRAGMLINYDIPWNPVRVIQRVGRINRISKKVFDELYIVNFFPTEAGAELVKSREIASNKMFLIHNTLGEDAKIFDIDEEPTPAELYQRIQQNPEKLEEESFYTRVLQEFMAIKERYPDLIHSLDKFPLRVKVAKRTSSILAGGSNELFVFIKKGRLYIRYAKYDRSGKLESSQPPFEDVLEKIKCPYEEELLPLSLGFWDVYEGIKGRSIEYRVMSIEEKKKIPPSKLKTLNSILLAQNSILKTQYSLYEKSLEQQASNNLKTLINKIQDPRISEYKGFLRMLLEDILDYGTLPDYTLRRIANLKGDEGKIKESIEEIKSLMKELGENYLEKEKLKLKDLQKEIIVAIENQGL